MVARRRRGMELEAAIHRAVLEELVQRGYADLTYEGVAARAQTSKPVLYRRWATKAEMVLAALVATIEQVLLDLPDTGTLAGDIVHLLRRAQALFSRVGRRTVLSLLAELDEEPMEQLRPLLFAQGANLLEPILRRACDRGELGPVPIPPHVRTLPFDLARHELLIRGAVTDEWIHALIVDLTMPLFDLHSRSQPTVRSRPPSSSVLKEQP